MVVLTLYSRPCIYYCVNRCEDTLRVFIYVMVHFLALNAGVCTWIIVLLCSSTVCFAFAYFEPCTLSATL